MSDTAKRWWVPGGVIGSLIVGALIAGWLTLNRPATEAIARTVAPLVVVQDPGPDDVDGARVPDGQRREVAIEERAPLAEEEPPAPPAGPPAATPPPPGAARGAVLVDAVSRSAAAADVAGTAGTLDKEAVQRGIQAAKPKIASCYERSLVIQPELAGRVVVEFQIERDPDGGVLGTVTSGEVVSSDVSSPFFEACVLKEVAGTQFDAPTGGGVVTVRYPFQFASDAPAPAGP